MCANYTFTADNFDQQQPIVVVNELAEGQGCWMHINRTVDGSFGTVALEYDNKYLYLFDDLADTYESGKPLGLIEEQTALGWGPREFFVANGGLMPTRFNSVYNEAASLAVPVALASCILALAALF